MTRAVAINVGANTNQPGFRGPVFADGTFAFVPIPEPEPTSEPVPTYGDLAPHLPVEIPDALSDTPVHLDPEFREYPFGEAYTYGDPHGVKARPLASLAEGDWALFYATLDTASDAPPAWQSPDWGTYLIGGFRLACDPVTDYDALSADDRDLFASNAHVKRETMDAAVLLLGGETSGLFDQAVPLSSREAGVDANRLVTELSSDSGKGPWWRRPMKFDADATAELFEVIESRDFDRIQG
ncbi:hypothetical protein [Halorarius litoreus]|uniref:Nmad3 family putative nucleotide modification protein n=1 Tax=Halorarius litoreus TaxID=2962676 RepID=UPI0020CFB145|nr:hypothetical protein [Halorarius litoreus]